MELLQSVKANRNFFESKRPLIINKILAVPLKGIIGEVILGTEDITNGLWKMQPKLSGEWLKVYTL